MDSPAENQAEQKPETVAAAQETSAVSAAAAPEAKDDVAAPPAAASEPKDNAQEAGKSKEGSASMGPPPIPNSALVVLPSSRWRFEMKDDTAGGGGGAGFANRAKWLRYGSRAALVLTLLGCAYALGGRFLGSTQDHSANVAAVLPQSESAELDRSTKALSDEIRGLETRLESLRVAVQIQTPDEIRGLKKSIDGLKASLDAAKTESDASIAQLSAKLDHLQREGSARLTPAAIETTDRTDARAIQATLDKAARAERTNGEPLTTASIPATSQAATQVTETSKMTAEPQKKPPQLLTSWVVRDVYDGIALVEGPPGAVEVMPGDTIPGAGVVKAIERRGDGWIVLTSRGLVDYDHE
jgi:hypothetical protein